MQFQIADFLGEIDSVMIIDENFIILHAMRINNRIKNGAAYTSNSHDRYINQSIFDIFPSIPIGESSYSEARITKKPVLRYNQQYTDCYGMVCRTNNITIPLLRQGKVCGYVGLSKDITKVETILQKEDGKNFSAGRNFHRHETSTTFEDIITNNKDMRKAISLAQKLAAKDTPILIYGETGTGKELFVQAIINYSNVPRSKVITQNCAAIPDSLIESVLFGTTKGSFTGAETKEGLLELASDGILFLDELNSLPYHVQGNLLRVLQEGTFRPVGAQNEKKSTARIIAAMNINPREAIEKRYLREDLFYRFSNSLVSLTPLKNRTEDIDLYLEYFLEEYRQKNQRFISGFSDQLRMVLNEYSWPGNVRELSHLVEFMVTNTEGQILNVSDLPAYMTDAVEHSAEHSAGRSYESRKMSRDGLRETWSRREADNRDRIEEIGLDRYMEEMEKEIISNALYEYHGSIVNAGEYLRVPRQTLTYKMKKYDLDRASFKHPKR
ncbi:sigma-54 interaction domain-containing protein [Bacilliculturomica massiliensis]|uniref:sigma-54 interaction domain-containing protein n=1 Tax=Bacilliculturomica massiliensis TaxID=1917867 RepID=UPI0013EEF269|nr:sigma 54-interacting transcriptional regulator [Bacilliculturomica massiliensis]